MQEINWSEFVNLEYWLEGIAGNRGLENPNSLIIQSDSWIFWTYLGIFAFFMIFAIILQASQTFLDDNHPLQKKVPTWSGNIGLMGFLGFCWFFFRETNVSMLNSRIWLLVGIIWLLIFFVWVGRYLISFYPLELAAYYRQKTRVKESAFDLKSQNNTKNS